MAGIIPSMPDVTAADPLADLEVAVRNVVAHYLVDEQVPGISLAITGVERTLISIVDGWADLDAQRPIEPDTLFEIGSIGKVFTAEIVLQLVDEGRLALDDPVVRHVPWFVVPRYGPRITIHHLLGHTAGITAGVDGTPEAVMQVWRLRDLRPGSAPGRRVHYSNLGYKILGLVIEAVDGVPFAVSLQRRILEPWGMATSEAAVTHEVRPRLAVGYEPARDDRPWSLGDAVRPGTWLTTDTADGCTCANADDMAAAVRALLRDEAGHTARMIVSQPVRGGEHQGYGLNTLTVDGHAFVGKGGGMIGYTAGLQWEPASGLGAVVLQNGPFGMPNALARLLVRMAAATQAGRDPRDERFEVDDGATDAADATPASLPTVPEATRDAVVGAYRSHDPWTTFFRIEARGDTLYLTFPFAPDGFDDEQPLVPMAHGWFRVGLDRLGPERLRFDTVIDGLARRAWLSGWDYYRVES